MILKYPNRRNTILTIVFVSVACVGQLMAHAILFESTPARNAIIGGHLGIVKLRFNVRVDASRSRLALVFPSGSLEALEVKSQEPADVVAADVSDLPPGHYDLKWQVLASDGHITQGDIPFAVK